MGVTVPDVRVVVLTGAGISAESGVPTFRDADGLWEGHPIEDVATPAAFRRDPRLVWQFYNARRANLARVEPNPGHAALARLEAAHGPLPVTRIHDTGFYVQAAFFPVPRKLELYSATSQIFGDEDAGFGDSSEYQVGMNFYPANTRNHRLNIQLIDVNRSPVSSTFGYYTGGQTGQTLSVAFSVFF